MQDTILHKVKMISLFYENLQCIEKICILLEKTQFAERLAFKFSENENL